MCEHCGYYKRLGLWAFCLECGTQMDSVLKAESQEEYLRKMREKYPGYTNKISRGKDN